MAISNVGVVGSTNNSVNSNKKDCKCEKYEWFFKDEQGKWIKYGKVNSKQSRDCVPKITSNEIEKHFMREPTKCIELKVNKDTRVERTICRKEKSSDKVGNAVSLDWTVKVVYEWYF